MKMFKGLIVGSNNIDIYTADELYTEIATVFDPRYAVLFSAAPDLLEVLMNMMDYPEDDLEEWANGNQPVTLSYLPCHIRSAKDAIEKALNYKK